MKIFADNIPFYKANFHCHTTQSDGILSPEECVEFYRNAGYDILSITDHRRVTMPAHIHDDILLLPGIELDYVLPEEWGIHFPKTSGI